VSLLHSLTSLPAGWIYLAVGLLVFAEDAVFVGFLIPGETAAVIGGVTANSGRTNLVVMMAVVVAAAILGDSVGYEVGRRFGGRLLASGALRRRRKRVDQAREYLARRGGPAVLLGRFVAFLRATMPFLAGSARMRYRRFLSYNAAGGLLWGVGVVLLGFLAGAAYQRVARTFGAVSAVVVAVLAVVALLVARLRRRRAERSDRAGAERS
jgi:membrane-associated protein